MKKVAILQSNYIPWKGYFDLIAYVDEFILYDEMQYTRRDWRNRNRIKTPNGLQWLTVPVSVKGKYYQKICETKIADDEWKRSHWKAICQNYKKASYFDDVASWLEPFYVENEFHYLSTLNKELIHAVNDYLGIDTRITSSSDYNLVEGKTERLADLCKQVDGDIYVSGPAAKDYIVDDVFSDMGVDLMWFDYSGYPEYPQLWGGFVHGVSIIDLLMNCGPDSANYMKYVNK